MSTTAGRGKGRPSSCGRAIEWTVPRWGTIVDAAHYNPFGQGKPDWLVHADVTSLLLAGCINRRELLSVLMDGISTPPGCSLEEEVRRLANRRLKATGVVTAACVDSRTSDLVQVADLVASAVRYERQRLAGRVPVKEGTPKASVANRLGQAFGVPGLVDGRTARVNLATFRRRGPRRDRP